MSVISKAIFEKHSDRVAKQYELIKAGVVAAAVDGVNGDHFDIVTASDDYDVENAYITPANSLDTNCTITSILGNNTDFRGIINASETHVRGESYANLDAYLSGLDCNVDDNYDELYNAVRSAHLDAINVFGPATKVAEFEITGAGADDFTHITAIGTGSGKASATNHAAAIMQAIVTSEIGVGSDLDISLTMTNESGNEIIEGITIPAGSELGTTIDTSGLAIDVTNVVSTAGTNLDAVDIYSKIERVISL